ncbi:UNVERIFIED_CONTAM: hypothetical protein FKN15_006709 [Acipenser sinensis]
MPGWEEDSHNGAGCPYMQAQGKEQLSPQASVAIPLPPLPPGSPPSREIWDWLVHPEGNFASDLPWVINTLRMRDGERWEDWEQQHDLASVCDLTMVVLGYLAADMGGVPSSEQEGEEQSLPSPVPEWEEPERPTPEWEEPERPMPDWEEPERPAPDWEEPYARVGGVGASTAQKGGSLGCDDYLGSDKVMDKCGVCGGDNTACKVVSGVFKHTLMQVGYHKVVEIPEGATKINITEMIKSRNYLALRTRSGRSIINGNWAIDRPGKYEGVGTMFTYRRPNEISSTAGESFIAEGPTNEIADVYMIYQQPNPGVHYEFILPVENLISSQLPADRRPGDPLNGQLGVSDSSNPNREEYKNPNSQGGGDYPDRNPESHVPAAPPPSRQRDYNWKQAGTTECTATCGRGSRFVIFRCIHRVSHEEVSDSLCDSGSKPSAEEEPCNVQACPAFWDIGEWSECSKTCGLGMQHRQVLCRQVYANRTLTVQPNRCQHLEKPETTSTCQLKICSEWQIRTEWSSCGVPCGVGQRSREVRCVSNVGDFVDDKECNMKLRPNDIENCDMGPCAKSWFFTEWGNRCSADCGVGVRSRSVLCMTNHMSSLPLEGCGHERPAVAMACNSGPCESRVQWFAGSWSQCSAECGSGTQQREVVCLQKSEDSFTVLQPFECASLERPLNQQTCSLKACGAKWYHTDWSSCSKSCEGGFRVREVRCLSDDMTTSDHCEAQLRPEERETCNTEPCAPEIDENCRDKYFNCNVVVQARLCVYNYYKAACCASCTRVANRHPGFLGRR